MKRNPSAMGIGSSFIVEEIGNQVIAYDLRTTADKSCKVQVATGTQSGSEVVPTGDVQVTCSVAGNPKVEEVRHYRIADYLKTPCSTIPVVAPVK